MSDYDVLIIGSGAAGQTVASACAAAGRKVGVIDRQPFGGTCSLRGCVPKKVLFSAAETVARAQMLAGKGVSGPISLDWPTLAAYKRTYTDPVPERTKTWMRELGIDTLSGTAAFVAPDALTVDGARLTAPAIVIATGARPITLGIPGEEHVSTSTDFLELERMPTRVLFIGGGYISFEFAAIAQRAGADVTIVHRSAQVLEGFDPTLTALLVDRYRALGIEVLTDSAVEGVERLGDRLVVRAADRSLEADLVVHGAGRIPDLADLDLDAAGVAFGRRGVAVDRFMRSTTNPGVWALGDAADAGVPLTPVASAQGEVVAANILGGTVEFEEGATPSVVFSDPPMATVGVGVETTGTDDRLESTFFDMGDWFSQTRAGSGTAGAVLVIDTRSDTIVGAHLLGVDADEVINVFALAIRFGITLAQLRTVTWSYPTLSYEINYLTGRY
jgi:glutathione reductase (NADPH)